MPERGSKSVTTTSGSHSSTASIHVRTLPGSSRRMAVIVWVTDAQRRISPSSIANVGPKTSLTLPSRSPRYRNAAPEAMTRTSCPLAWRPPMDTSERVACPSPSPFTPYRTRTWRTYLSDAPEANGPRCVESPDASRDPPQPVVRPRTPHPRRRRGGAGRVRRHGRPLRGRAPGREDGGRPHEVAAPQRAGRRVAVHVHLHGARRGRLGRRRPAAARRRVHRRGRRDVHPHARGVPRVLGGPPARHEVGRLREPVRRRGRLPRPHDRHGHAGGLLLRRAGPPDARARGDHHG